MFEKTGCNMTSRDAYIRAVIASSLMLFAFLSNSFLLGTVAIFVFYTAYTKFCFVYFAFKINNRFSKDNYYLSLLPKHRTSPIFIFHKDGSILFKNKLAKTLVKDVNEYNDLLKRNQAKALRAQEKDYIVYKSNQKYFQIELVPVSSKQLILAYFNDITEALELNDAIEETQREVIYAMGEIGETRSKETGNHVKRVALYSKELALLYGMDYGDADILHMASPMHDIGKVGIPDAILNAPRKLTKEEFEIMKTHAELGHNMLKHSDKTILKAASIVAGEHHEKFDGFGYPNGTKGEDIHIYGRITAVADVFDALGSERVYKKAWELEKIIELFKEEKGKHFDPKLVDIFLNNLDSFLKIRDKFKDI